MILCIVMLYVYIKRSKKQVEDEFRNIFNDRL